MAKRILVPITPDAPADYVTAALSAARIARKSGGMVRLAYISPLPPPRLDKQDHVIADTGREMERITAAALERLAALASEMDGVPVESVVRFGRLSAELALEAEVFDADLIALAALPESRFLDRVRAWQLRRAALASKAPVVLLPLPAAAGETRTGGAVAVPALR
jgi:nucleotide-binding universal stress UspA family protein